MASAQCTRYVYMGGTCDRPETPVGGHAVVLFGWGTSGNGTESRQLSCQPICICYEWTAGHSLASALSSWHRPENHQKIHVWATCPSEWFRPEVVVLPLIDRGSCGGVTYYHDYSIEYQFQKYVRTPKFPPWKIIRDASAMAPGDRFPSKTKHQ